MQAIEAVLTMVAAAFAGLTATAALERRLRPTPLFRRPVQAWAAHTGIWCWAYGVCLALFGHLWLVAGCVTVIFFILVLVNNAKMRSLHEPFVFQDYEYFTDAIRYPRLYMPFFGWNNFFIAAASVLLFLLLAWHTAFLSVSQYKRVHTLCVGSVLVGAGTLCLYVARRRPLHTSFEPAQDIRNLGLLPCIWQYALASRALPRVESPFARLHLPQTGNPLPHMVAVQSESFFDPGTVFPGIRAGLLSEYHQLKAEATAWGKLSVPAWGANTVRTEFAFLSGINNASLGAHRFNPYRALARGWQVSSVAQFLRSAGYRTVCIHPYYKSFYLRDRVFPLLGFDEFRDITAFSPADRCGPYTGDAPVAEKVLEALRAAETPLFLFVITMENHGPLHLEKARPEDAAELYDETPQSPCDELTVYLRHIRNADAMLGRLRQGLDNLAHPTSLCWYGDHLPILTQAYGVYENPPGKMEYVLWSNQKKDGHACRDLESHHLALEWCRSHLEL